MSTPPAERAIQYVRGARAAVEFALSRQPPRGCAGALAGIRTDLDRVLEVGAMNDRTVAELRRVGRRLGALRQQLPPIAAAAIAEAQAAVGSARWALEQAIGSGGG
jgi:hypothetical protein